MSDPKETIEALNLLMNGWQTLPKKFCLQKIFGWSKEESENFLKEYKKEKRKYDKDNKSLLDKVAEVSTNCCGQQCCSND